MTAKKAQKQVPIRTCIYCKKSGDKKEFVRFAKIDENIVLDLTGKARGRGANICPNNDCLDKAFAKKLFNKALKTDYKIEKVEFEKMKSEIVEYLKEKEFRPNNKPVKIRISKNKLPNVDEV